MTKGEDWQSFRLDGTEVFLDQRKLYLVDPGNILAVLREILRFGAVSKLKRTCNPAGSAPFPICLSGGYFR